MRYSIKTLDGCRFDFTLSQEKGDLLKFDVKTMWARMVDVPIRNASGEQIGTKYFVTDNIVSITEMNEEEN